MDIASAMHHLLTHTDRGSSYLEDPLNALSRDLRLAIASYRGLQLTLHRVGRPFSVTSWEPAATRADVATSLHLPASVLVAGSQRGGITLWAAVPGAFVDLAADVRHALGLGADVLVLDEHLSPTAGEDPLEELAAASWVDQAVGVLIARGHTPEEARAHLTATAEHLGQTLPDRAADIVTACR